MLTELSIRNLGVIAELDLLLGPGMTALTGETGTGKTMVVEAIDLLLGGRADSVLVRPGAGEARVDGRFVPAASGEEEIVLARVVPAGGRSRAYVNGAPAPVSALAEAGDGLVDLHGQHTHQSLFSATAQRAALDAFAGIGLAPLQQARDRVHQIDSDLAELGGDARSRAREIDLLRFQVGELEAAGLRDPGEDEALEAEEDRLADATAHREAASRAHELLTGDGGAGDGLRSALAALQGRAPVAAVEERLRVLAAETDDLAHDLRTVADTLEDDPERLAAVRERRQLLHELRRKYGETLAGVLAYRTEAANRLAELESHDERVAALEADREKAVAAVAKAEAAVLKARRAAAPKLAGAIEERLRELAMPKAHFDVAVDDGGQVTFLLGANPGEPALPLAKVASGGELARTMLAVRLVLTSGAPRPLGAASGAPDPSGAASGAPDTLGAASGAPRPSGAASGAPDTLVFDEVDAGIGGEAAVAVGRALAALATRGSQVLVVTHLPQVAAFADHQVAVWKEEAGGRTVARAEVLDGPGRVTELSRMLSGQPESAAARGHAEELLAVASKERAR
ncbi:MAG TPA: DNA repair protein RecN [Acidimicrobiales bacterium]|nr:DNA repair protein RecN [Acidimicrobiales bacterium]